MQKKKITQRSRESREVIGVIGLGYVGLPLACAFAEKGVKVLGFEVVRKKVELLKKGKSYVGDISSETVRKVLGNRTLVPTVDFSLIRKCDCVIICVPTPLRKTQDPDISYIIAATEQIAKYIRKGTTVVLESTTYPGSTREVVGGIIEKRGFRAGTDFYLAFSPERVDPANKKWNIKNTPKVIGGINSKSLRKACAYYSKAISNVIQASSLEAAEMVKLLENTSVL